MAASPSQSLGIANGSAGPPARATAPVAFAAGTAACSSAAASPSRGSNLPAASSSSSAAATAAAAAGATARDEKPTPGTHTSGPGPQGAGAKPGARLLALLRKTSDWKAAGWDAEKSEWVEITAEKFAHLISDHECPGGQLKGGPRHVLRLPERAKGRPFLSRVAAQSEGCIATALSSEAFRSEFQAEVDSGRRFIAARITFTAEESPDGHTPLKWEKHRHNLAGSSWSTLSFTSRAVDLAVDAFEAVCQVAHGPYPEIIRSLVHQPKAIRIGVKCSCMSRRSFREGTDSCSRVVIGKTAIHAGIGRAGDGASASIIAILPHVAVVDWGRVLPPLGGIGSKTVEVGLSCDAWTALPGTGLSIPRTALYKKLVSMAEPRFIPPPVKQLAVPRAAKSSKPQSDPVRQAKQARMQSEPFSPTQRESQVVLRRIGEADRPEQERMQSKRAQKWAKRGAGEGGDAQVHDAAGLPTAGTPSPWLSARTAGVTPMDDESMPWQAILPGGDAPPGSRPPLPSRRPHNEARAPSPPGPAAACQSAPQASAGWANKARGSDDAGLGAVAAAGTVGLPPPHPAAPAAAQSPVPEVELPPPQLAAPDAGFPSHRPLAEQRRAPLPASVASPVHHARAVALVAGPSDGQDHTAADDTDDDATIDYSDDEDADEVVDLAAHDQDGAADAAAADEDVDLGAHDQGGKSQRTEASSVSPVAETWPSRRSSPAAAGSTCSEDDCWSTSVEGFDPMAARTPVHATAVPGALPHRAPKREREEESGDGAPGRPKAQRSRPSGRICPDHVEALVSALAPIFLALALHDSAGMWRRLGHIVSAEPPCAPRYRLSFRVQQYPCGSSGRHRVFGWGLQRITAWQELSGRVNVTWRQEEDAPGLSLTRRVRCLCATPTATDAPAGIGERAEREPQAVAAFLVAVAMVDIRQARRGPQPAPVLMTAMLGPDVGPAARSLAGGTTQVPVITDIPTLRFLASGGVLSEDEPTGSSPAVAVGLAATVDRAIEQAGAPLEDLLTGWTAGALRVSPVLSAWPSTSLVESADDLLVPGEPSFQRRDPSELSVAGMVAGADFFMHSSVLWSAWRARACPGFRLDVTAAERAGLSAAAAMVVRNTSGMSDAQLALAAAVAAGVGRASSVIAKRLIPAVCPGESERAGTVEAMAAPFCELSDRRPWRLGFTEGLRAIRCGFSRPAAQGSDLADGHMTRLCRVAGLEAVDAGTNATTFQATEAALQGLVVVPGAGPEAFGAP